MPEAPGETVPLAEFGARPVRVTHSPIMSLFILVLDALHPGPDLDCGLSTDVRAAIRSVLPPSTQRVLAPLVAPYYRWPDALLPRPGTAARELDDVLAEIVETPEDRLVDQLVDEGLAATPEWQPVVRGPRRWLAVYAGAMLRAWDVVAPHWRRAAGRLDREVARVELAARRGALPELIAGLSPVAPFHGDELLLPGHTPRRLRLPDDGIALIPLLTGPDGYAAYHRGEALTHFAYPLPGPATGASWELEALVGRPRALVLRLLDAPLRSGAIARALTASPSFATRHVAALEAAGLVTRHRNGRHVWVERTARGTALLELFEP